MNDTQTELEARTLDWLRKLEDRIEGLDESVDQMENVEAYLNDTRHFLEEEDYIRAFESVTYAWGILETLERLGKL